MTLGDGLRVVNLTCRIGAWISAVSLAILVAVLSFSAIERYLFTQPLANAEEICALLFIAVAFLGMGDGYIRDQHIRIGKLVERFGPNWRPVAQSVGAFVSVMVLSVLLVQTFSFAYVSYQVGSRSQVGDILLWPWMSLIPLGIGLLVIAVAARGIARVWGGGKKSGEDECDLMRESP